MELTKSLVLILVAISITVIGQTCLKTAMNEVGRIEIDFSTNYLQMAQIVFFKPLVWCGLSLYGIGAVVWLVVLSRVDLSFAYPMLALSYVILMFVSFFRFHENISVTRIIGTLLICLGVIFISRS